MLKSLALLLSVILVAQAQPAIYEFAQELLAPGDSVANPAFTAALDGDVAVLGDPTKGKVFVYARNLPGSTNPSVYSFVTILNGTQGFGTSVAVDNFLGLIIVGNPKNNANYGSVFFYHLETSVWTQVFQLEGIQPGGQFGFSLSVHENLLVVGGPGSSPSDEGLAFVFEKTAYGPNWVLLSTLTIATHGDQFGYSVWMNDDGSGSVIIGSPGIPEGGAFIYSLNQATNTYSLTTGLFGAPHDLQFGEQVAISGCFAAVGALTNNSNRGELRVYGANTGVHMNSWGLLQALVLPSPITSIAFSGPLLAAGLPGSEKVALFQRDGGCGPCNVPSFEGSFSVLPLNPAQSQQFGENVAILSGDSEILVTAEQGGFLYRAVIPLQQCPATTGTTAHYTTGTTAHSTTGTTGTTTGTGNVCPV